MRAAWSPISAAVRRAALAAVVCGCAAGASHASPGVDARAHLEQAASAERFIDSIGLNVHLSYHDGPYGRFPAVSALLRGLGVRHLRDGVVLGQDDVCREDRALSDAGMHFTYITQVNLTPANLKDWASCVGPALEAYEGLNEYDISHPQSDANWPATVQNAQRALYRDVKGTATLARIPVIGPSLTSQAAYRSVGDLSASMDQGNMHDYFAGHEPGTGGWGFGGYGSIAYNLNAARDVSGEKPIVATETGYATPPAEKSVTAQTQAAYVPRMFLEHFKAGVARTYEYELVDEGGPPFGTYGLTTGDLRPKPAYTALASLIHLLNDRGATRSPQRLRYALAGTTENVHHALFVKHDGRFYLALWQETASSDPAASRPIAVAPVPVTLKVDTPLRKATLYRYDAAEHLRPAALSPHGAMRFSVADRICVLELVPAKAAT